MLLKFVFLVSITKEDVSHQPVQLRSCCCIVYLCMTYLLLHTCHWWSQIFSGTDALWVLFAILIYLPVNLHAGTIRGSQDQTALLWSRGVQANQNASWRICPEISGREKCSGCTTITNSPCFSMLILLASLPLCNPNGVCLPPNCDAGSHEYSECRHRALNPFINSKRYFVLVHCHWRAFWLYYAILLFVFIFW